MIIQYIQLVIIFAGIVVIGIAVAISVRKQARKNRLYDAAERLLLNPDGTRPRGRKRETVKLSPELLTRDAELFLSLVQVSDITEDAFLKEVVNQLTGGSFLPEVEPAERPLRL